MKYLLGAALALAAMAAPAAPQALHVWRHETGDLEMVASAKAVERFNRQQSRWRVVVETLPQGSYQQAVTAAAMTGKLPCVLDLDQPSVPNFAWAGHIQPLEGKLRPAGADALIAGGRSTLKGKLYAVGHRVPRHPASAPEAGGPLPAGPQWPTQRRVGHLCVLALAAKRRRRSDRSPDLQGRRRCPEQRQGADRAGLLPQPV